MLQAIPYTHCACLSHMFRFAVNSDAQLLVKHPPAHQAKQFFIQTDMRERLTHQSRDPESDFNMCL